MDRYGYLANPGEMTSSWKKYLWLAGLLGFSALVYLLVSRSRVYPIGRIAGSRKREQIAQYTVTAPAEVFAYSGAGMPFDIAQYWPAEDYHFEVDGNGISRLVTNNGIPGGIIRTVSGQHYFVAEGEWNQALAETRERNADILLTISSYNLIGSGYLGYCTSGAHIGEPVYVTLDGQIGRALYREVDGEMVFVPLEVIDQTPDIWSTYIKPGGR
jgi:hypothetical protein